MIDYIEHWPDDNLFIWNCVKYNIVAIKIGALQVIVIIINVLCFVEKYS